MRTAFLAFALAISFASSAPATQKPPSKAEPLLRVYVHAVEQPGSLGPSVERRPAADAVAEIQKKIKGRKKWFEIVSAQGEAEIVIGVLAYGVEKVNEMTRESAGADRSGTPITRDVMVVKERHHIQAEVSLPLREETEKTMVRQGTGKSLGEAADGLTKGLEEHVKANYSRLVHKAAS